eukprot:5931245-Prymnesium_polylepis.1
MERRRVHKMPTVSSFLRQPQRVVRARRREKRPFRFCDPNPCLDAREAERLRLTVSLGTANGELHRAAGVSTCLTVNRSWNT